MFIKTWFFFFVLKLATSREYDFTFNGFSSANLSLEGIASITSNGVLELTNSLENMKGHAFYPTPLPFKSATGKVLSVSTTFVFAILPEASYLGGEGIIFFDSRTTDFSTALPNQYFGLLNANNNGNASNHVLASELDTIQNPEFQDTNDNHVGIDINSLKSNKSLIAGYHEDSTGLFKNMSLISGQPMQVWIDFNGEDMQLDITLSPMQMPKPTRPLLSSTFDPSNLMLDSMYVDFSSADGPFHTHHYILGWSFKMNEVAGPLHYAKLPSLPLIKTKGNLKGSVIWLPITLCSFIF